MNKITWILGIVIVLVLIWVYGAGSKDVSPVMEENKDVMMKEQNDTMLNEAPNTTNGGAMMEEKTDVMMEKAGTYEVYSPEKLALADSGDVVLFFRASWCPTCRALDADIRANLNNIPSGVVILDVDYDNSTVMKQKYGVTYQHTLVQVDSAGNQINKWMGSPNLASLVTNIK